MHARQIKEALLRAALRVNPGASPDYVVIGAQKAGTSALAAALTTHPQIYGSLRKEVHYFDLRHKSHPLSWYRAHFLPVNVLALPGAKRRLVGEASPSYMLFPDVASRLAELTPKPKILVVLRDPSARAISHFQHNRRIAPHLETQNDAETAIFSEHSRIGGILSRLAEATVEERRLAARFSYLRRGQYAELIKPFIENFGMGHVLVIDSTDMINRPVELSYRLCEFLEAERHLLRFEIKNQAGLRSQHNSLQSRLTSYFEPYQRNLAALDVGDFQW